MTYEPASATAPFQIEMLEASRPLGPWTRYEDQIFAVTPDDFTVKFVGNTATAGDMNVDLIHGRDSLDRLIGIDRRTSPDERLLLTQRFTTHIRDHDIALVRTIFASRPAPKNAQIAEAQQLLDEATTIYIKIDETTPTPDPARTVLIPNADLSDRFIGFPVSHQLEGRVLSISSTPHDTGATGLLKTSFLTRVPGLSFRVVGDLDSTCSALLDAAAARTPQTVSARREHLSDAALVQEITACELVVLRGMSTLEDVHLFMMCLSLGRPVLLPKSSIATCFSTDAGAGWVLQHEGPLTAEALDTAILTVRSTQRTRRPNLAMRGWAETSHRYFKIFRAAVSKVNAPFGEISSERKQPSSLEASTADA